MSRVSLPLLFTSFQTKARALPTLRLWTLQAGAPGSGGCVYLEQVAEVEEHVCTGVKE